MPDFEADVVVDLTPAGPAPEATTTDAPGTPEPEQARPDTAAAPAEPAESNEERRNRRGVQRRIDELTSRAAAAERREQLLLETMRAGASKPAASAPTPSADAAPREEDFPDDFRAYLKATAKWEGREEAKRLITAERDESTRKTQEQKAHSEVSDLVGKFEARKDTFATNVPDYNETIANLDAIELGPRQQAMTQTLLQHPDSAKVLYHLGKNVAEARRIAGLPPVLQAAAIGEFAASLRHAPTPSKAPPPGKPVGSKSLSVKDLRDPSTSYADFKRIREAQIRASGRR